MWTRNPRARRRWCPLCGKRVAIHGGYPDHYWRKHTDPVTGLVCGQSDMYVLSPAEGGPGNPPTQEAPNAQA